MEEHEESSESLVPIYTKDGQWRYRGVSAERQGEDGLSVANLYKGALGNALLDPTDTSNTLDANHASYSCIMSTSQQYQMSVEANPALHADRPGLPSESLIADAHTRLSLIFNSFVGQHRVSGSQGTNGLALVLYCPLEGGEYVIDATVHELAQRSEATVTTIDLAQLINEKPRSFWEGE
ncbi:hypothetical protein AG1IA_06726 [Rhizoctonia solani AG-1 IA]|uniref:Uncharacterized protein n=1 Tax=Thanatephorus cucumeris (strain AG1-IA) TaxID=983506 RepID=L8WS83_THACA|nr:hypothetical protein AG1IA_06726 [Rhizoctonia solani AG-1 IA]